MPSRAHLLALEPLLLLGLGATQRQAGETWRESPAQNGRAALLGEEEGGCQTAGLAPVARVGPYPSLRPEVQGEGAWAPAISLTSLLSLAKTPLLVGPRRGGDLVTWLAL